MNKRHNHQRKNAVCHGEMMDNNYDDGYYDNYYDRIDNFHHGRMHHMPMHYMTHNNDMTHGHRLAMAMQNRKNPAWNPVGNKKIQPNVYEDNMRNHRNMYAEPDHNDIYEPPIRGLCIPRTQVNYDGHRKNMKSQRYPQKKLPLEYPATFPYHNSGMPSSHVPYHPHIANVHNPKSGL